MTGTARTTHGAREHLARLAVVLAVLAGLALIVGVQCTDGMSMGDGPNAVMAGSGHEVHAEQPAGMLADHGLRASSSSGTGDVLAACLMLIMAVVVIASRLKSPGSRSSAAVSTPVRGAFAALALPPPLSLAKLCLLRI